MEDKNSFPAEICLWWASSTMSAPQIISLLQFVAGRERVSFVACGYGTVAAAICRGPFLLQNLIAVLASNVCTTWDGIIESVVKMRRDKILMLCLWPSVSVPLCLSFLSAVKLITRCTAVARKAAESVCLNLKVVCVKTSSQTAPETLGSVRGWKVVPLANSEG